jgi:hnRNP-L/PTB/hephaestus splicing factor
MAGIKRNIQEMYNGNSNANTNTNGHNHSSLIHSNETTNVNDAKKTRLDNNKQAEASRVVHLRNIPTQLTENEIIYLGLAFGPIKNVLFLRSKSQAFLEFERLDDSQQMCTHFQTTQATFSGKKIFVQFSNHAELNTDPSNSNNLMAQTALAEAGSLHKASRVGGKNTVLRATILNMIYPVTLDVLQQIFSKFGPVLKCITFNKNDKFQVLIQMFTSQAAQNARQALNNQNIYNGCCTLQIEFSKLITLEVRFNNDKSRDYTNMLLPTGNDGQQMGVNEQQGGVGGGGGNQFGHFNNQSIIGNPPNM